ATTATRSAACAGAASSAATTETNQQTLIYASGSSDKDARTRPIRTCDAISELFLDAEIEGAARSVPVGKFAEPGHAAQQIDLVEQDDQGEADGDPAARRPEVDLLVGRNGSTVEFQGVGRHGAEPGPGEHCQRETPRAMPQISHLFSRP